MFAPLVKPFQHKPVRFRSNEGDNRGAAPGRKKQRAKHGLRTLQSIWLFLAPQKDLLSFVLLLVIFTSLLGLLGPFLIGRAIDHYIVVQETNGLARLLLGLLAVYFCYSLFSYLQNYLMIGISQNTVYKMRAQLFQHLHKLPIQFFDQHQHGELMSRITNDIDNVSSTLNSSMIQICSSTLTLLGTVIVMLTLSPLLTLVALITIPLMFFGIKWITLRTGKLFKEQQRNLGDLNGMVEEAISGQRVIKTFTQEKKVIAEFKLLNEDLKNSGFWAQTYSGFIPKVMNVLNNLNFAMIVAIGGLLALYNVVTIGVIVIFAEYSRQFTRPLNDLSNQFNTMLSAIAGAERVFDVLHEEAEDRTEQGAIKLQSVRGEVEFSHVSFSYEQGEDTITDVSFKVPAGESVALIGATGAGKSTIIQLLSRFYELDSGHIFIDGHDLAHLTRKSVRQNMAFVLQDTFLFETTIRENIRYGKLEATDEEVVEAAMLANAHSFIMKMPDGYDTVLKQDGSGISQGQKQLLSIARAILADPSILILDEATSSIDTVTELKIQEALYRLMEGRTSFVIAHRLNTIQKAGQIIVLEQGRIVENGSPEQLLERKGHYYRLCHTDITP